MPETSVNAVRMSEVKSPHRAEAAQIGSANIPDNTPLLLLLCDDHGHGRNDFALASLRSPRFLTADLKLGTNTDIRSPRPQKHVVDAFPETGKQSRDGRCFAQNTKEHSEKPARSWLGRYNLAANNIFAQTHH